MRKLSCDATKKANTVFAFVRVVGDDGLEPPTYAV
jgi:hypothetical protein